jgi:hypothetical protein
MPILVFLEGAQKEVKKLGKKHHDIPSRVLKTKELFDANHKDPKLDFKKHKSLDGVWKIRLVGQNDGRRLLLRPHGDGNTYVAYTLLKHDELDQ